MEPINILLVDDQPAKLLSYEVILRQLNENLIKAHSGREALEHLLKTEVAVILVDVCMPDQDGFELVSMIREHPRYQKTAVIFVSAVMMDEPHRLRGYEAGAVDYVSVPVVPELLRAKVKVFAELFRKTRDLERLNAQLEERVAERTAALEASAAALKSLNEELEQRIEDRTREREEALAQLFEAQKMETIGQLTGGVAHDFNNLLMAALGSLNLVRKSTSDERAVRLLDNAIQAAERGAALTQRLLAFARRQELKPQPTDVVRLVQSMESLLRRSIGPGVVIDNRLPSVLPPILVDSNQFELALLNLFINARDAMPDGGTITLTASTEAIAVGRPGLKPGNYVSISVADTGCGMDDVTVAKATEPFYTTKGPGKGTGLGLSMVYGLTAQSDGTLLIESKLGEGTRISMWIPLAEAPEQPTLPPQTSGATLNQQTRAARTILVVDDDALVMMGTAAMLEDLGHYPVEAMSGREALEILGANTAIEMVVTDHAMPGMSGAELTRHIKQRRPELPVVLASGYAEPPDLLGLEGLPRLGKPFTQRELQLAIAAAFADSLAG